MQGQYNMRSPAVKRLMKEAQELRDPTELYFAQPLEDNLFEWHFTLRGPEGSDFDGGIYHGRIVLPAEYPMKPPSIIMLTPNGRFETNKKICLSISGHHPESWQPSWSIRTALLAIIGFMPTHGGGAIGSLDYTPEERKVLAKKSQDWKCQDCGELSSHLKPVTEASEKASQEARELATQINFQEEKQANLESKNRAGIQTAPETTASANAPPNSLPAFPWSQAPGWPTLPTAGNIGSGAYIRFPYPPLFMYPAPSVNRPEGNLPPRMAFFPPMPFIPPTYGGTSPIALPAQPPTSPETSPACASSGAVEASSILPETVGGDGSKTVPTVKECCPETSDIAEKECLRTTSSASTISPSEFVTADSVSHNNAALCIEETVHSLSGSPEAAAPFECVAPVTADSFTNVISASGSASDISSSGSETSTATTIAAPVLTESTNLRLRHTQNVAAAQITTDIGGAGAAPLTGNRAPPQQESGMTYVVMMIMLIVAISLLLVRRILQCFTSDVHAVFKS